MSADVFKVILTLIVVMVIVAITLIVQMVQNRRGDRAGTAYLLLAVVSTIALGFILWNAARAEDALVRRPVLVAIR